MSPAPRVRTAQPSTERPAVADRDMRRRLAACLLAALLVTACSPSDGGDQTVESQPTGEAKPAAFPEELACEKFYELMGATLDEGDLIEQEREDLAVLADKAASELDILAAVDPVDEDGNPSRIGELTRQSRELDDAEEAQEWAAEFRDACGEGS